MTIDVSDPVADVAETVAVDAETPAAFAVRLDNFEGPFDLLLSLIAKHKLDITEVALSKVTDEFISFIKAAGPEWDLEQTTQFLLVASTLVLAPPNDLFESLMKDEEHHIDFLETQLDLIGRIGLELYTQKHVGGLESGD